MRQSDNLKSYIGYFQSQLAKISNCGEDVSVLAFISGLQVSHPLYKHLLKHNVTRMSEVLSRAQPYIQLEVMKTFANYSAKRDRGKSKALHEASAHAQDSLTEPTTRYNNSLRSGSPSMKSSTLSRINLGSGIRDPSSMTPYLEQKSTAPTTTVRDTRSFIIGASEST